MMAAPKTKTLQERLDQQKRIWNMWTSGMSKYRIAKILGCHETNIGAIIKRMEYKLW
jgi:DNA-binding CsgD family transcriptional regulator